MFLSLLRISVRNITRNTRRSLITAAAVFIGASFIIFARGMLNGFHANIVKGFTEIQAGDLQLHHPEYLEANEALPLDKTFPIDSRFQELMSKVPGVEAYTGRVLFSGMVSKGEETTLFFGMGIDPVNEYKVCPKNVERLSAGSKPVSPDNPKGIVLGKALADSLQVGLGTELTLLVNTKNGSLNGMDVTVVGIGDFALPGVGNKLIQLPLATAQRLLALDDQVTEVAINVTDLETVLPANQTLLNLLAGPYKDVKVSPNTWMDIGQIYVSAIELQNQVLWYIIAVLFIVMVAGIVNTMLMSVFERVREIGTMMAVGVRRTRIVTMFILESLTLGAVGAVSGVGTGWLVVEIAHKVGITLTLGETKGIKVHPYIRADYMLLVTGIALLASLIAAIFPAIRTSRLRPAEALRTL